jgi:hypothetical protein
MMAIKGFGVLDLLDAGIPEFLAHLIGDRQRQRAALQQAQL